MNHIKNDITNTRYENNEDVFFSKNIKNKPSVENAKLFCVETIFSEKSFAIHSCYRHLSPDELCKISEYIPELYELSELNR